MASSGQSIFISYARDDVAFARDLRERLLALGHAPWMDLFDIPAGARWPSEIDRALKSSDVIIGLMSPAAVASENVMNEWDWAIANGRRLVLLLIKSCEIPFHYVSINYLDFTSDQTEAFAALAAALDAPKPGQAPGPAIPSAGISEEVNAQPAVAVRPAPRRPRELPTMVGRERELARLREHLSAAFNGDGGLVLIGGEAGIGKTTLVSAAIYEAGERGALVLTGGCYDLTTTPPYGPWVEVMRAYPDEQDGLPRLPNALREGSGMEGIGSQTALFDLIAGFLVEIASHQPLVIDLEDLHWSDPASLELLRVIARIIPGHRILLVGTYRDDELTRRHELYQLMPVLVRESDVHRIDLNRLDASEIQTLLADRYNLAHADEDRLRDHLHQLSEGNPFYLGELLRSFETDNVLKEGSDGWKLVDLAPVQVPPLIRQVIDVRLSNLDQDTRSALEIAAVIGHRFGFELWSSVSKINDELLLDVLEESLEAHVLVEQPQAEEYQFSHALVRETLYEGLVRPRRRIWHQKVADALITTPNPDPDEVADHLQRCNDPRTEEWLTRAGERAQERFAWFDAAARFEDLLELLEARGADADQRGWLLYRTAQFRGVADPAGQAALFVEVKRLADESGDHLLAACSSLRHSIVKANSTGHFQLAVDGIESAINIWEALTATEFRQSYPSLVANEVFRRLPPDAPDAVRRVNILRTQLPHWYNHVGRFDEAVEVGEQYLRAASETNIPELLESIGFLNAGLGWAHAMIGNPAAAQREMNLHRVQQREAGFFPEVAVFAVGELSTVHMAYRTDQLEEREALNREFDEAWELSKKFMQAETPFNPTDLLEGRWVKAREELEFGTPANNRKQWYGSFLGELARNQGDTELAWKQVGKVLSEGPDTRLGITSLVPAALALARTAAALSMDVRSREDAREWLVAHDRWMAGCGAVPGLAEGQMLWGRYDLELGNLGKAREHAEKALTHASDPRQPLALVQIQRFLGELCLAEDDHATAETWLQESLGLAEACAIPFERALTLLEIARLRAATGDRDEARRLLDDVRQACEPLEARPTLERVAELQGELGVADG